MSDTFKHLKVWQTAVDFSVELYALSKKFPKEEVFGLTSQLRRAGVSISANIAEGAGRSSKAEFARFVDIALGSLNEVETLSTIARRLEYITEKEYREIEEAARSLGNSIGALRKYLKNPKNKLQ